MVFQINLVIQIQRDIPVNCIIFYIKSHFNLLLITNYNKNSIICNLVAKLLWGAFLYFYTSI
jgi:hypothetical protein